MISFSYWSSRVSRPITICPRASALSSPSQPKWSKSKLLLWRTIISCSPTNSALPVSELVRLQVEFDCLWNVVQRTHLTSWLTVSATILLRTNNLVIKKAQVFNSVIFSAQRKCSTDTPFIVYPFKQIHKKIFDWQMQIFSPVDCLARCIDTPKCKVITYCLFESLSLLDSSRKPLDS